MKKKLTLGREADHQVEGVCAGLADYFDADVAFIRIAFLLTAFLTGVGFAAYIACWIAMPKHPEDKTKG